MTTERRTLPPGWQWVRLGELAEFCYGKALPTHSRRAGPVPVYGSNGVAGFHDESLVPGPTIIVGRKGSVGAVHYSGGPSWPIDTAYFLRIRQPLDLRWLVYSLRVLGLERLVKTTAIPGFNREDAYRLVLPFPPLPEQHRIVARLTAQLAEVERAQAAVQAQQAAARALSAACLRQVFYSSRVTGWPTYPLSALGEISAGVALGRKLNGQATQRVSYLRVANVQDGYLDLDAIYETEATRAEIDRLRLQAGDLLLTEGGDPDKLGRGTIWRNELPQCIHQNHIFRVRLVPTQVVPAFAALQIASPYGKAYFLRHAKRTTGIATINRRVLGAFPMMAPPLADQRRIVARLTAQLAEVERAQAALDRAQVLLEAIPPRLLQDALTGGL